MTIIAVKWPGFFQIGPFPKMSMESGGIQTSISLLGQGEYNIYKKVVIECDKIRTVSWALVKYEMFEIKSIDWIHDQ